MSKVLSSFLDAHNGFMDVYIHTYIHTYIQCMNVYTHVHINRHTVHPYTHSLYSLFNFTCSIVSNISFRCIAK